ncbi:hypothetical protein L1887_17918 [Cichorium endivia]|nr:hypothetical protein L1887_17918 [Cichorium endivia]
MVSNPPSSPFLVFPSSPKREREKEKSRNRVSEKKKQHHFGAAGVANRTREKTEEAAAVTKLVVAAWQKDLSHEGDKGSSDKSKVRQGHNSLNDGDGHLSSTTASLLAVYKVRFRDMETCPTTIVLSSLRSRSV